ncbi:MAG: hypothetical protein CMJ78_03940 [Planctomycetaceae bacterium]|nr:hypothetical protein [Planctomycetaceae bacterium]
MFRLSVVVGTTFKAQGYEATLRILEFSFGAVSSHLPALHSKTEYGLPSKLSSSMFDKLNLDDLGIS